MAPVSKLHGRAFYESLGSPKFVLAPMVDQSEFAWRLLTRSFLPDEKKTSVLAYSPMLHARLFADSPKYRASHFEPVKAPLAMAAPGDKAHAEATLKPEDFYLDGNPKMDRPLFVQFCANDPDALLEAAKVVAPYCDAVDLNLGCPQGIAKRGHYGAFLQEDWDLISKMISKLHAELDIPVTAKMRVLDTKEKTLDYAKMILAAGASIITVHGRQREQKGHNTGLADWTILRYLREQLPQETVIFANGNILQHADIHQCLEETKADGVMSAEGNLYDPSIFAEPPAVGNEGREYWRGKDGKGGYRADAVLRRYLDIIHRHVLGEEPPQRKPLFLASDPLEVAAQSTAEETSNKRAAEEEGQPPTKKQKIEAAKELKKNGGKVERVVNANFVAMQAHCFHILRPLVSKAHNVRDALARCKSGDIAAYENVLSLTEAAVRDGLLAYEADPAAFEDPAPGPATNGENEEAEKKAPTESSDEAVRRCRRPYWVCQSYVRPLPKEAYLKGSMQLSKKELKKLAAEDDKIKEKISKDNSLAIQSGVPPEGVIATADKQLEKNVQTAEPRADKQESIKVPENGMVCG
ncbi:putative dihydrouridine synthase family protein [Acrodontium crateriforme]|uniref:tRNA-dihydrouridine(16/17) synthase [NAD(P)(+)] n=1 Tax=Acrodontium crateriforme TaxID=150365 RepID=A0AAQ3MD42_9PEZI|nr:putative dihydrouridine synthase family protein [Acrodontium crateriforme]